MSEYEWNLWIWEGVSWRVLAAYYTRQEAVETQQHQGEDAEPWTVTRIGSPRDEFMRANCTKRRAPQRAPKD